MNWRKAGPAVVSIVLILALLGASAALTGCGGDSEPGGDTSASDTGDAVSTAPVPATAPADTQPAQPVKPEPTEVEVVAQAAIAYARANNPSLPELEILEVKMAGGWARVDLQPVDRSTDAACALLKNVNGQWSVVDFGLVLPENHPEAPPEIFE